MDGPRVFLDAVRGHPADDALLAGLTLFEFPQELFQYLKDYLTGRRAQHLLREARLPHAAGAPHLRGQDARHGRLGRALRQAVLLLRHRPQVILLYGIL